MKSAASAKKPSDAGDGARAAVSLWVRLLESHNLMLGEIRRRLADHATMPRFDLLANLEREDGQTLAALISAGALGTCSICFLAAPAVADAIRMRRSAVTICNIQ